MATAVRAWWMCTGSTQPPVGDEARPDLADSPGLTRQVAVVMIRSRASYHCESTMGLVPPWAAGSWARYMKAMSKVPVTTAIRRQRRAGIGPLATGALEGQSQGVVDNPQARTYHDGERRTE